MASLVDWHVMDDFTIFPDMGDATLTLVPSLDAPEEIEEYGPYQVDGAGSPPFNMFRELGDEFEATVSNSSGGSNWSSHYEGWWSDNPYPTGVLSNTDDNWSGYYEINRQDTLYPQVILASTDSYQEEEKDVEPSEVLGSDAGDDEDSDTGDEEASETGDEISHESDCGPDVNSDEEVYESIEIPESHHSSNKSEDHHSAASEHDEEEETDYQHPYRGEGQYRVWHHSPYGKPTCGSTVHKPGSPKLDFDQSPRGSSTPDIEDSEDEYEAVKLHKTIRDSPSNHNRNAGGKVGGTGMTKLATLLQKNVPPDTPDSTVGVQSRGKKRSRPDDEPLHGVPNPFTMSREEHQALVAKEVAKRKERGDSDSEDEEEDAEEAKPGEEDAESTQPPKKRSRQMSEDSDDEDIETNQWWIRWESFKGDKPDEPFFDPAYGSYKQDGTPRGRKSSVGNKNGAKSPPHEGSGTNVNGLSFTHPGHYPTSLGSKSLEETLKEIDERATPTSLSSRSSSRTLGRTPSVPGSFPTSPGYSSATPSLSSRVSTNVHANGTPVAPGYIPASPPGRSSPKIKIEDIDE